MIEIMISIAALLGGGAIGWFVTHTATKGKVRSTLKKAEEDAENLKRNKLLEAKEKFINMKAEFEKEVVTLNEVLECFHVSGDYDYILKICVKDMEEYREFMVTKLTTLQHIGSTHSTFMIGEVKNSTSFVLN